MIIELIWEGVGFIDFLIEEINWFEFIIVNEIKFFLEDNRDVFWCIDESIENIVFLFFFRKCDDFLDIFFEEIFFFFCILLGLELNFI